MRAVGRPRCTWTRCAASVCSASSLPTAALHGRRSNRRRNRRNRRNRRHSLQTSRRPASSLFLPRLLEDNQHTVRHNTVRHTVRSCPTAGAACRCLWRCLCVGCRDATRSRHAQNVPGNACWASWRGWMEGLDAPCLLPTSTQAMRELTRRWCRAGVVAGMPAGGSGAGASGYGHAGSVPPGGWPAQAPSAAQHRPQPQQQPHQAHAAAHPAQPATHMPHPGQARAPAHPTPHQAPPAPHAQPRAVMPAQSSGQAAGKPPAQTPAGMPTSMSMAQGGPPPPHPQHAHPSHPPPQHAHHQAAGTKP